jgi:hypothetical protein
VTPWLLRRRQALDRGGVLERANKIATGHNADDIAETILLNMIRGDVPRRVVVDAATFDMIQLPFDTLCAVSSVKLRCM